MGSIKVVTVGICNVNGRQYELTYDAENKLSQAISTHDPKVTQVGTGLEIVSAEGVTSAKDAKRELIK